MPQRESLSAPSPAAVPQDAAAGEGPSTTNGERRVVDLAAAYFHRWREGDSAAARELVELLTPTLWHSARAYRVDGATAEDIVQSAWLALARRRDSVREPQAVLGWLVVTVRRDAARAARARSRFSDDPADSLEMPDHSADADPATTVARRERDDALWTAVGRLSERCRRLLRVIAFADRPDYAALSNELAMPIGSIGPTRGRCLKKLRSLLGEDAGWRTS